MELKLDDFKEDLDSAYPSNRTLWNWNFTEPYGWTIKDSPLIVPYGIETKDGDFLKLKRLPL